jgi:hypothetical protein
LIASPVLACVLDCACRDKPSWRGHSCDTSDNQWSGGVVIAGFCSFGALDHQRRVLHQSSLLYLTEDQDSTSYQVVSVIRLPMRYTRVSNIEDESQKSQKNFTRFDLQPSLSLLHNLVSESVVLSSCPRLSLVAGLDLF